MDIELVTLKDLREFKIELINELKAVFADVRSPESKSWLKGDEVKSLLKLSESKLQKLRVQGLLPSSKIGGVHYYKKIDIENLFKSKVR